MVEQLTYVQFAAKYGLVTDFDVQGHIHSGLMAAHMPKSYHRRYQKRLAELQNARDEGLRRYAAALEVGEIAPVPEMSPLESLVSRASGDADMPATQAARRILVKRLEKHVELVDALKEARNIVQGFVAYAGPHFQEKHDLKGNLAKLDALLGNVGAALSLHESGAQHE